MCWASTRACEGWSTLQAAPFLYRASFMISAEGLRSLWWFIGAQRLRLCFKCDVEPVVTGLFSCACDFYLRNCDFVQFCNRGSWSLPELTQSLAFGVYLCA